MTTLKTLTAMTTRAEATLVQDAVGFMAIVVMLCVGLHLPVLI